MNYEFNVPNFFTDRGIIFFWIISKGKNVRYRTKIEYYEEKQEEDQKQMNNAPYTNAILQNMLEIY